MSSIWQQQPRTSENLRNWFPFQRKEVENQIKPACSASIETGFFNTISDDTPKEDVDQDVAIRLSHIREGRAYISERKRPNGIVLKTIGNPMPGGGYVSTFTDITDDKEVERKLREAKETLEARVAERTSDLEKLTIELESARREAVGANASKTRFLAAASHDLMQPLNAARLFTGALQNILNDSNENALNIINKIDQAIQSSDQLLRGLLDISKLDHGVEPSNFNALSLGNLFSDIGDEVEPIADAAGLKFQIAATRLGVIADQDFLKSIVRNFVSNALRYTKKGGVLVGARRRNGKIRIEVWDSGVGIPPDKHSLIFEEFYRLEETDRKGIRGAGLGLAIARRMAGLMGAKVGLRSWVGKGSVFYVELEEAKNVQINEIKFLQKVLNVQSLIGLKILCVDDETSILYGMEALLLSWGCIPFLAKDEAEAINIAKTEQLDFAFLDYQLRENETGFDVRDKILNVCNRAIPCALLTADKSERILMLAKEEGIGVFSKPVSPSELQAFLVNIPNRD